jgi:4-carboxymuconolactone decarboxylase
MTDSTPLGGTLPAFDGATRALVRQAARITAGSETDVRDGFTECAHADVPSVWLEELVLQSYLFAGFPRALNAAREWHRVLTADATPTPAHLDDYASVFDWRTAGEATCATVYGPFYTKLRANIRALHPALDEWMIVEGYGKVLSRPGLDLPRRELCIVAACVAAGQDRQLHSHLHGSRHAGVPEPIISEALEALRGVVAPDFLRSAELLWARVQGRGTTEP